MISPCLKMQPSNHGIYTKFRELKYMHIYHACGGWAYLRTPHKLLYSLEVRKVISPDRDPDRNQLPGTAGTLRL